MKRRGFLGLLAALPALLLPRKAPAALAIYAKCDYCREIKPGRFMSPGTPDHSYCSACAKRLQAEFDRTYISADVGRPGGDETAVTVWQRGDSKFTDTRAWYLIDVCRGDPVTGCCMEHGSACSNVNVIGTYYRGKMGSSELRTSAEVSQAVLDKMLKGLEL